MNTSAIDGGRRTSVSWAPSWAQASVLAETMVNIAGIAPGDRVLLMGDAETLMATAIAAAGGEILRKPSTVCDVILWASPSTGLDALLPNPFPRHWLRAGGRLVVWCDTAGPASAGVQDPQRLRRALHASRFTSIIIGRLPAETGGVVVATGIFNPAPAQAKMSGHGA